MAKFTRKRRASKATGNGRSVARRASSGDGAENAKRVVIGLGALLIGAVIAMDYFDAGNVALREEGKKQRIANAQAKRANKRYENGCTIPMIREKHSIDEKGKAVYERRIITLSADLMPRDHITGFTAPPNAVLCDDDYNTAVLGDDGRLYDFLRADDEALLLARIKAAASWHPKVRLSATGVADPNAQQITEEEQLND